jgi:carbon monoxide dehydrogenase subunit G
MKEEVFMDIVLSGKEIIAAPKETLVPKLNDASFLVSCLPNVLEIKESSSEKAIVVQDTGFSFAKGRITLTISHLAENKMRFESKAMGGASVVDVTFSVNDNQEIIWNAEISLMGILKLVPKGLIEGASNKVIATMMEGIRKTL